MPVLNPRYTRMIRVMTWAGVALTAGDVWIGTASADEKLEQSRKWVALAYQDRSNAAMARADLLQADKVLHNLISDASGGHSIVTTSEWITNYKLMAPDEYNATWARP